jgi:hypothetical protein
MAPVTASTPNPSDTGPLSNADVLDGCRVSDDRNVYLLGCLEKRVTLYAQQVRALNLVAALIEDGRLTRDSRVAIVGGGAAGLTAAAAIALALPKIKALNVYERMPELLHLQTGSSHRYLHPHIYDWPNPNSLEREAGLPVLTWTAGPAAEVAEQILSVFTQVCEQTPQIQLRTGCRVERVYEFPGEGMGCRVRAANHSPSEERYDVALLSIGFGMEHHTDKAINRPYWDAHLLVGPLRGSADTFDIFVSGNGDGGLVDFMIAAFDGRPHEEILRLITEQDGLEEVKRVLLEIEEEAWKPGSKLDIYEEYRRRLTPILPIGFLKTVSAALRQNADVCFHTRNRQLFRHDTAVLNRFVVFLALEADQKTETNKLRAVKGYNITGEPFDETIRIATAGRITPNHRYLRFGTDTEPHFKPFLDLVKSFQTRRPAPPETYRPATPPLTVAATTLFPSPAVATSTPRATEIIAPEDSATAPPGLQASLSMTSDGKIVWSSGVPSSSVQLAWGGNATDVILRCEMTPDEAGPLRFAVARLLAHAGNYRLFSHNTSAWTAFLKQFLHQNRPGPVDFHFHARTCVGDTPHGVVTEITRPEELASRIHLSLDHEVLERLNRMVEISLRSAASVPMGWRLEAGLRAAMLGRWREWFPKLLESDPKRRRFLMLLVSPDDGNDLGPAGLVRVGPKCVEPHLLGPTLLALAFSVGIGRGMAPSASFPGNLGVPELSAHAVGVKWLDGLEVGPEVAGRTWATDVVLLSELREPPVQQPVLPRLDHAIGSVPGIRDVPPHEQPLILGYTHLVRSAFQIGEGAVRDHFTSVLRGRAKAAARMLDNEPNRR